MAVVRTFGDIAADSIDDRTDIARLMEGLGRSKSATWEDILQSPRILLISEAGTGKTHECKEQIKRLRDAGELAFFLELSQLASSPDLKSLLDYEEEALLAQWVSSQSDIATFFLDSIDELKLTLNSFETALKRFGKGIEGQLARARIVVTTRPVPFDGALVRTHLPVPPKPTLADTLSKEERFASVAVGEFEKDSDNAGSDEPPAFRTVGLIPLSDSQVVEFAREQGVLDAEEFFADPEAQESLEFARRPQDIIELCAEWKLNRRIGTHREQVEANVRIKLQPRVDRKEAAELSADRASEGASRLALAMVQTRTLTIRYSSNSDKLENTAALNPARILTDWRPEEVRALLERPLFNFASYERVRFHHQSVLHFLASERIRWKLAKGMPFKRLRNLLFADTHGTTIVRPSLRTVAGWLALTEPLVFEVLRDNEPSVLFDEGDPRSLLQIQRDQALRAYVARFGRGGWRGMSVPMIQLNRFASAALASTINKEWAAGIENDEVRQTLLHLVANGKLRGCADLVEQVAFDTTRSDVERMIALRAMDVLDHPQLAAALASIAEDPSKWSSDLSLRAVSLLFPHRMSVDVLCAVVARTPRSERLVTDLQWRVTRLVAESPMSLGEMERLRDGLMDLILTGLRWEGDYPHLRADNPQLTGILAALCIRGVEESQSVQWLQASFAALRLQDRQLGPEQPQRDLLKVLASLGAAETCTLFGAAHALFRTVRQLSDPWHHLLEIIAHERYIELRADRDLGWIKDSIADTTRDLFERNVMLAASMRLPPPDNVGSAYLEALSPLVADSPELSEALRQFILRVSDAAVLERWQEEDEERRLAREEKRSQDKESWIQFWRQVANDPESAFSKERVVTTAHNLWRLMRGNDSDDRASGWNRKFIEQHFGEATANQLRLSLMDIWRNYQPTLPCERPETERNTYFDIWLLGLSGIFAEAENPKWTSSLTEDDARRAARFSLIYLNSLPHWMEDLSTHHPAAVDDTIGVELSWELAQPSSGHDITLLYHLAHGTGTTARVVMHRFMKWLNDEGDLKTGSTQFGHLTRVLDIILKHGNGNEREIVEELALGRLARDLPLTVIAPWLHTLMRLNPEVGVGMLERLLSGVEPTRDGPAVNLFNSLFGDRSNSINPKTVAVSPQTLLRLARLAYHHMRPEHDQRHDGAYTPNARDDAQRAREAILGAILEAKGPDAWTAKLELAGDPISGDYKDRVLALAEEAWAHEIDGIGYTEAQAAAFDRNSEAAPMTDEGMFMVMMDRLDDIEDLLLRDISPRDHWARIDDEHIMRREIARVLDGSKRDIYRVNQEAVTADEKETDIRLTSTASDQQAVIELKLGENYSGRVLRDTIKDQLVEKYMAPSDSRSGCLFVTVAEDKNWEHPDTAKKINIDGLRDMLNAEAVRVASTVGGSVRLAAFVLDLRKRLGTEAERRGKSGYGP
ncbi:ATP-binding protein [Rhizobium leguminosarum]|uniref:ATP-binding protein n=1 Tax=Rhizobium leguminosarum TaxID=384 RepID=UPI0013B65398|nr:ATP-binding protein [Rhizobium leguminosarum]NEI65900.1 ATP-binding protein [Rhizobium leguminosarum]